MFATALIVGAIAAVGYVLHIAQSAPTLETLRPLVGGGSSQVFAADGTPLGFIQADQLRTPVSWSQIPTNLKNATVARTSASTRTTGSTSPGSFAPP